MNSETKKAGTRKISNIGHVCFIFVTFSGVAKCKNMMFVGESDIQTN